MTTKANAATTEANEIKAAAAAANVAAMPTSQIELAVAQAASRKAKVLKVGMSTGKVIVAMAAGAALTIGVQKYQARRQDNLAAAQ